MRPIKSNHCSTSTGKVKNYSLGRPPQWKKLFAACQIWMLFILLSSRTDAKPPDCIQIGLLGEFTRPTSRTSQLFGMEIQKGVEIALKEIQGHSRLCQTVKTYNISNATLNIPDIIKHAIHQDQVKVFIGLSTSEQALIGQQTLKDLPAILVTPTASGDFLNFENKKTVLMFPSNSQIVEALVDGLIQRGIRETAIIYVENNSYSKNVSDSFEKIYQAKGGKIVKSIALKGVIDISSQKLSPLNDPKIRHVFLPLFELDATKIISLLMRTNPSIQFIGTDAWGLYSRVFREFPEGTSIKALLPFIYSSTFPSETNRKFTLAYSKLSSSEPSDVAAFSYDGVKLVNQVLNKCNLSQVTSKTSDCIKKSLPFSSTTGTIDKLSKASLARKIELKPYP